MVEPGYTAFLQTTGLVVFAGCCGEGSDLLHVYSFLRCRMKRQQPLGETFLMVLTEMQENEPELTSIWLISKAKVKKYTRSTLSLKQIIWSSLTTMEQRNRLPWKWEVRESIFLSYNLIYHSNLLLFWHIGI